MNKKSVKLRFFSTVVTNVLRAGISFIAGVMVARVLGPSEYGNFDFLCGSFTSLATFVNMSSSTAFYTFISQKQRGRKFFLYYSVWVLIQFLVLLLFVLFLSGSLRQKIWLGHSFELVLLALFASFAMNQLWTFAAQIGESIRDTVGVQVRNLALAAVYLVCILVLSKLDFISVKSLFILDIILYLLFSILYVRRVYQVGALSGEYNEDLKNILAEFKRYCLPLVVYTAIVFMYSFADYWFLQKFGGSTQQGYYAIGMRFANVSLIATISMMQVFWKEIAEAYSLGNMERIRMLYRLTSRISYSVSAAISCAMIPFTREILALFVGPSYQEAWLPLSLMFFSPLYQSMGQVATTMLYATGKTKIHSYIWIFVMALSIPITYLLLASHLSVVPGLQLGAIGLAIKRLGVLILGVNLAVFFISRRLNILFDWGHQIYVVFLLLSFGFLSKLVAQCMLFPAFFVKHSIWVMALSGVFYAAMVMVLFYFFPSILGMNKQQIKHGVAWVWAKINPAQMVWR